MKETSVDVILIVASSNISTHSCDDSSNKGRIRQKTLYIKSITI